MIRRAEIKDTEAIEELLLEVLAVHNAGRPDIFKPVGQKYTRDELESIILDDNNPVFVFEDQNGKVLGHCFCQMHEKSEGPATYASKTLYIDDLCVGQNTRGMGVGKALYDFVKQFAKDNGCSSVTLHAWECNPNAVSFYRHLGMKVQQYTMEEIL